jgi:general secretion pathway protein F
MKYKITYIKDGKIKSDTIKASSKENIDFSYEILSIKEISDFSLPSIGKNNCDSLFKELSIIVSSSLTLAQTIHLLLTNTKNSYHKEILTDMKQSINNGQNIDIALQKHQKNIGILPILFFRIGYLSGDMKKALQNLVLILEISNQSKKRVIEAIRYPVVVMIFLILAMVLIFNFVVPQFEILYGQFNTELPFLTKLLLYTKGFFGDYGMALVGIFVIFALIINYKLKTSLDFKQKIDKILFYNIPLISKIISLWQIHRFFLTMDSFLDSKYSFAQSLQNGQLIATNTYVLEQLKVIEAHIQSGGMINVAFEKSELFDDITNRLIYSGEISNTLPQVIKEIQTIYYARLEDEIKTFSSIIEPLFLLFIAINILWLVLALMLPIWEMGNVIR